MPYIKQSLRKQFDPAIKKLCELVGDAELNEVPGILNYIISRIVSVEVRANQRYITINKAMGVLACVQQELYRRLASGYEDQKCKENGDVFDAKD